MKEWLMPTLGFTKERYSFITAQIISCLTHRGSVEVERVLRRL
jgi:hypothetical protein